MESAVNRSVESGDAPEIGLKNTKNEDIKRVDGGELFLVSGEK